MSKTYEYNDGFDENNETKKSSVVISDDFFALLKKLDEIILELRRRNG